MQHTADRPAPLVFSVDQNANTRRRIKHLQAMLARVRRVYEEKRLEGVRREALDNLLGEIRTLEWMLDLLGVPHVRTPKEH